MYEFSKITSLEAPRPGHAAPPADPCPQPPNHAAKGRLGGEWLRSFKIDVSS